MRSMNKIIKPLMAVVLLLTLGIALPGSIRANEEVVIGSIQIVIAAGAPGSSWNVFSETLIGKLKTKLPKDTTYSILPEGNGIANPTLLNPQGANLALSYTATALCERRIERGLCR